MSNDNTMYSMLLVDAGCGRGPMYWVIFPTGANYIEDEIFRLPGGSRRELKAASQLLEAMNG